MMGLNTVLFRRAFIVAVVSVSLNACSGGTASPLGPTVPTPTAVLQTSPTGYNLLTSNTFNPTTVYTSVVGSNLVSLGIPQGPNESVVLVNAPAITAGNFNSAIIQQFNPGTPIALVASTIPNGILINAVQNDVFAANQNTQIKVAESVSWTAFNFSGFSPTSNPVGVEVIIESASNTFIGVNFTQSGSFLAQASVAESAISVLGATQSNCQANSSSTAITTLAAIPLSNGSDTVAMGTNWGELMFYNPDGSESGTCTNLTNATIITNAYALGSPIIAITYTSTSTANYWYFATQNNQVWRITANSGNQPQGIVQIAGSNSAYSSLPAGQITSLFSDSFNNVYVGSNNGMVYTLAPTNSSGGANTIWTSVTLDGQPVLSVSGTVAGSVIGTTVNGIYNISFNGNI